jgi:uncharacterized protein (TIGR03000 family)
VFKTHGRRLGGLLSLAALVMAVCDMPAQACWRRHRTACVPCWQVCYQFSPGCPAHIRVQVPAGARLYFDGAPTQQTGTDRWFSTPPLPLGGEYTYALKAEFGADGKASTETKQISVRAGLTTHVAFSGGASGISGESIDPELGAAAQAPTVVSRVPPIPPSGP